MRFFPIIFCIFVSLSALLCAAEKDDYLIRSNPEKIKVRSSVTYIFNDNTANIKSLLVIDIPIPETNIYQNIKNGKIFTSTNGQWKILKHPETGGRYAAGIFEFLGNFVKMSVEFEAELFDVEVDFSKMQKTYPYNKKSLIYQAYTGISGNWIDPQYPAIQNIGEKIAKESKDTLDYAEKCYIYVANNFRYSLDFKTSDLSDVLQRKYGDCGCFTNVYVSLLRYQGIPARAVYGVDPKNKSDNDEFPRRHAWAEFFLEKYGWIPVDVTAKNSNKNKNYFGVIPKQFVTTSFGTDISCLSCEFEKLQMKKINCLQLYSGWIWYNKNIEYKSSFEFKRVLP